MSDVKARGSNGESTSTVTDRRARVRYAVLLDVSCQPVGAQKSDYTWAGKVRDISTHGIGLLLRRRFERGAILSIDVQGAGDLPSRTLLARVVHAQPQPQGYWVVGCALATPLSEDDLRSVS